MKDERVDQDKDVHEAGHGPDAIARSSRREIDPVELGRSMEV